MLMTKEEFRQHVALALLGNIKDWMPKLETQALTRMMGEEIEEITTEQQLISLGQRGLAVLLHQQADAIVNQIY